jgi:uncharacterized protein GlcG (DUF336 family)
MSLWRLVPWGCRSPVIFDGGYPIEVADRVVGAIGVNRGGRAGGPGLDL